MALFSLSDIAPPKANPAASVLRRKNPEYRCTGEPKDILSKHIGQINQGEEIVFWSFGRFSQYDLLFYILNQIGPAHVEIGTWSLCMEAMERILRTTLSKDILSMRFILDPRVKVRNPKPLDIVTKNYPFVLLPFHAKVTLIYNDDWAISVNSSMNMTSNPRSERGTISTSPEIFSFDKEVFDGFFR